jgi:hypothetical protein
VSPGEGKSFVGELVEPTGELVEIETNIVGILVDDEFDGLEGLKRLMVFVEEFPGSGCSEVTAAEGVIVVRIGLANDLLEG